MSDAAQPTAAEVRAAAEAIKAALDHHLEAVERRTGDDDPAVYEAFNALAAAAEFYDELLYDRYDEVTPSRSRVRRTPSRRTPVPRSRTRSASSSGVTTRWWSRRGCSHRLSGSPTSIRTTAAAGAPRSSAPASTRRSECSSASTNRTRSLPGTWSSDWRRATPRSGSRRPRSPRGRGVARRTIRRRGSATGGLPLRRQRGLRRGRNGRAAGRPGGGQLLIRPSDGLRSEPVRRGGPVIGPMPPAGGAAASCGPAPGTGRPRAGAPDPPRARRTDAARRG